MQIINSVSYDTLFHLKKAVGLRVGRPENEKDDMSTVLKEGQGSAGNKVSQFSLKDPVIPVKIFQTQTNVLYDYQHQVYESEGQESFEKNKGSKIADLPDLDSDSDSDSRESDKSEKQKSIQMMKPANVIPDKRYLSKTPQQIKKTTTLFESS